MDSIKYQAESRCVKMYKDVRVVSFKSSAMSQVWCCNSLKARALRKLVTDGTQISQTD